MAYGLPYGMASRNVAFCIFLAVFLHVSLGQTATKSEVLPEFLALLENYTVTQGRDVSFTCVVNHLQSYKVAWIKSDSKAILAIHTHMVAHNPRLSVTHNGHNTWKLHVTNVQPNDSGTYMCQVNTDPMRSQTGHMKVMIPPDIMDLDDAADLLTTKENGDLQLRCRATGTPEPVVTWRREDGRNITLRNEHGVKRKYTKYHKQRLSFTSYSKIVKAMRTYEGEQLHLKYIQRQEMGSYLCIASNGVPPSVSKRYYVNVHFKPLIKVSNRLIADRNVLLQCYVESSPKALNTWYRNNGLKLLEDEKHDISEIMINDYTYQLNLTMKYVDRNDFGTYTCSAQNAFGRAESSIKLQELHLSKPTIASTRNTEVIERQTEYLYVVDRDESALIFDNVGRTTPMSRRNVSSSSYIVNMDKSKIFTFPAPAPAPAHSAPTQLDVQNSVRSSHNSRLCHISFPVLILLFLIRN